MIVRLKHIILHWPLNQAWKTKNFYDFYFSDTIMEIQS